MKKAVTRHKRFWILPMTWWPFLNSFLILMIQKCFLGWIFLVVFIDWDLLFVVQRFVVHPSPNKRQPDHDDIWSSASSAGWDVDALVRTTRLYRRMLQPIAGEKCQLKVYVYPPPKLKLGWLFSNQKILRSDMLERSVDCCVVNSYPFTGIKTSQFWSDCT